MRHSTSILLFSCWTALRNGRSMPDLADFSPGLVREPMLDGFIIRAAEGRLTITGVGERLSARLASAAEGAGADDLWPPSHRAHARSLIELALQGAPVLAGLQGQTALGVDVAAEWIMLPCAAPRASAFCAIAFDAGPATQIVALSAPLSHRILTDAPQGFGRRAAWTGWRAAYPSLTREAARALGARQAPPDMAPARPDHAPPTRRGGLLVFAGGAVASKKTAQ